MAPCACSSPGAPPAPGLSAARPRHGSPFQQSRVSWFCVAFSPGHKLLMPSAQVGVRARTHSPGTAPAERSPRALPGPQPPPSSTGRRAQLETCPGGDHHWMRPGCSSPDQPGEAQPAVAAVLLSSLPTAFPEMPLTAHATQAGREETAAEILPLQRGVLRADASADCFGSSSCLS